MFKNVYYLIKGDMTMKKFAKYLLGMLFAGVLVATVKVDAQAALPCTYDIIYDANGQIANANEMLASAQNNLAASQAYYDILKASGTATPLELQQAADAVANAANVARWWTDQVNNANAYLTNIKARESFEDKFAANRAALADRTKLQQAKLDADNALNIANGVLAQLNNVNSAIASYQSQVEANPSLCAQLNELLAKKAALEADYAAKVNDYNAKKALYDNYLVTLNYAGYDQAFEDYAIAREMNRNNPNWKP